jgi:hypothetical protein
MKTKIWVAAKDLQVGDVYGDFIVEKVEPYSRDNCMIVLTLNGHLLAPLDKDLEIEIKREQ